MNINDFLKSEATEVPEWLTRVDSNYCFNLKDFFSSRVVYYPGAGDDGQPLKLFGSNHAAHCFIYVDYALTKEEVEAQLSDSEKRFKGYNSFLRINVEENQLTPSGWKPHGSINNDGFRRHIHDKIRPYAMLEILDRDSNLDDSHGPSRLAVLFMGGDGIATYDALFCQNTGIKAPYAMIAVDHAYGYNYSYFGKDGLLHNVARECNVFPKWILLGIRGTEPWDGYEKIDTDYCCGGMHRTLSLRCLYLRKDERK